MYLALYRYTDIWANICPVQTLLYMTQWEELKCLESRQSDLLDAQHKEKKKEQFISQGSVSLYWYLSWEYFLPPWSRPFTMHSSIQKFNLGVLNTHADILLIFICIFESFIIICQYISVYKYMYYGNN